MRQWILIWCTVTFTIVAGKIGFFWHISDINYDVNYSQHGDFRKRCWKTENSIGSNTRPIGRYGDFNCDSPWVLVESAVRAMKATHGDNFEFILWTGDGLTHFGGGHLTKQQLQSLQNVTDLLRHTFSSHFVFPVLGQEDSIDMNRGYSNMGYGELADLWRHWLPTEAIQTFTHGGYYTIEQKVQKLSLVLLNTNLFSGAAGPDDDPGGQMAWLESVLAKSHRNRETVYLVGHIPPGVDERQGGELPTGTKAFQERFNRKYLQLVRRYSSIIVGQFFGHLHSDSFRIVYSDTGVPVSWMFLTPAVSPKRTVSGTSNPGIRLYKFNTVTGQVLDYMQLYLDLQTANHREDPTWQVEYNLTHYYGLSDISANSLHNLVESFTSADSPYFERYYRANSVRLYSAEQQKHCLAHCLQTHYCAITRVDYQEFCRCLETAASALATSSATVTWTQISFILSMLLITILESYVTTYTQINTLFS